MPDGTEDPRRYVVRLARDKAQAAHLQFPGDLILAADTMVLGATGELVGKPASLRQATRLLSERSASSEEVLTGFCLRHAHGIFTGCAVARIFYKKIPTAIREKILTTKEWEGVCGGLRIEGAIGPYILRLRGDRDNVMGLPLREIAPLIKQIMAETKKRGLCVG